MEETQLNNSAEIKYTIPEIAYSVWHQLIKSQGIYDSVLC